MALSLQFLILSLLLHISSSSAVVLPVTKDFSTLQYVTSIYHGTPMGPTKLVVDLGGPFLWVDCASGHVSSSHKPIPSGSLQCSRAKANWCGNSKSCGLTIVNTITRAVTRGELTGRIVAVDQADRLNPLGSIATVNDFLFFCAPQLLLNGLASGAKGMLGLGRTRISLPSQLADKFGFHRKFSVCLSSSEGVIFPGDADFSHHGPEVSKSLMYTPLISNQDGSLEDYYINLKSIKVNGERLSINTSMLSIDQQGNGGTKLSTIVPYTTMETTIYETFTKVYIKVATSMNMTRVASVGPFGLCFSSDGLGKTPVIDLVLQSEMVKWRIHGKNSMVEVGDGVMCLGFLDGGLSPRASIVIGGHQLEDHLLEFNLGTSMLGFTGTSCSDFRLYSMPSERRRRRRRSGVK